MPLQEKYIILCDEVRQENNGKFLILGVYTPDIAVAQLPIVIPVLTFFVVMTDDRPDNHQFRLSVQHLEIAMGFSGAEGRGQNAVSLRQRDLHSVL